MISIKQISLQGTVYSFPNSDDSSKSIKVTVEKQTFQTINVDVIKPSQINSDDNPGESDIKSTQLSISVISDPGFKPGTILIDGVDTEKTVYTLQATKDVVISANEPTVSEKLPLKIQIRNDVDSTCDDVVIVKFYNLKVEDNEDVWVALNPNFNNAVKIPKTTNSNGITYLNSPSITLYCNKSDISESSPEYSVYAKCSALYVWSTGLAAANTMTVNASHGLIYFENTLSSDTYIKLSGDMCGMIDLNSTNPKPPHYFFLKNTLPIDASELKLDTYVKFLCNFDTMTDACLGMFYKCTGLFKAPSIPNVEVCPGCYFQMFHGCTNLVEGPSELPSKTLASECYYNMFYQCTNLKKGPIIRGDGIVYHAFWNMFYQCENLQSLTITNSQGNTADSSSTWCYYHWLYGVGDNGTITVNKDAQWDNDNKTGIPSSWTITKV